MKVRLEDGSDTHVDEFFINSNRLILSSPSGEVNYGSFTH